MNLVPAIRHSARYRLLTISLTVLVITLMAGLTPRGNYAENWIAENSSAAGIDIKHYGYLSSVLPRFDAVTSTYSTSLSLQFVASEQRDSTFRVILFFGDGCEDNPLIVGQWRTHLFVMQGCDFPNKTKRLRLSTKLDSVFNQRTDIVAQISKNKSELFVNGVSVSVKDESIYHPTVSEKSLLLIGNSPDGYHGWSGRVHSIEVFERSGTLTDASADTIRHRFTLSKSTENSGYASDSNTTQTELRIAKVGWFPRRKVLEPISIISLIENNKIDALINLSGFIPLGFCLAAILHVYLGLCRFRMVFTAVLLGTLVSLKIELLQVFIVARRSNLHDVLLNGLGAAIGSLILFLFLKSYAFNKESTHNSGDSCDRGVS